MFFLGFRRLEVYVFKVGGVKVSEVERVVNFLVDVC